MKSRVAIAAVGVVGAILIAAGCGSSSSGGTGASAAGANAGSSAGSTSASTQQVTIGVAAITEQSPNVLQQLAMINHIGQLLGWKVTVLNANGDPAQMAQIMSALVNENVNGIIDIAIPPSAAPQAMAAAKTKGIPIIAQAAPLIDPNHDIAAQYAPSDAHMSQLLAAQIKQDYPNGGQALNLEASGITAIVIRSQTLTADMAGTNISVAATHQTDLQNAVSDTQTAVADALHANPKINMVWGLQDFEFSTSLQTIKSQNLGNVGVFSYYLDPVDFGLLRADKGDATPMAVADSPVYDSPWYAFDSFVNKFLLKKSDWVTNESIHPFPYTLVTPENVQATGTTYNYPSYQPFFTSLWQKEGVKVNG
jgi:ABC-type sugar transport system substrate-binding protein